MELGFTAAPTDLAALAPAFGAAHLFIDDCSSGSVICVTEEPADNGAFDTDYCYSWWTVECLPCSPWITDYTVRIAYWTRACNEEFPELCGDHCTPWFV